MPVQFKDHHAMLEPVSEEINESTALNTLITHKKHIPIMLLSIIVILIGRTALQSHCAAPKLVRQQPPVLKVFSRH